MPNRTVLCEVTVFNFQLRQGRVRQPVIRDRGGAAIYAAVSSARARPCACARLYTSPAPLDLRVKPGARRFRSVQARCPGGPAAPSCTVRGGNPKRIRPDHPPHHTNPHPGPRGARGTSLFMSSFGKKTALIYVVGVDENIIKWLCILLFFFLLSFLHLPHPDVVARSPQIVLLEPARYIMCGSNLAFCVGTLGLTDDGR